MGTTHPSLHTPSTWPPSFHSEGWHFTAPIAIPFLFVAMRVRVCQWDASGLVSVGHGGRGGVGGCTGSVVATGGSPYQHHHVTARGVCQCGAAGLVSVGQGGGVGV